MLALDFPRFFFFNLKILYIVIKIGIEFLFLALTTKIPNDLCILKIWTIHSSNVRQCDTLSLFISICWKCSQNHFYYCASTQMIYTIFNILNHKALRLQQTILNCERTRWNSFEEHRIQKNKNKKPFADLNPFLAWGFKCVKSWPSQMEYIDSYRCIYMPHFSISSKELVQWLARVYMMDILAMHEFLQ